MSAPSIAHHVSRAKAERLVAAGRLFASTLALIAAAIGVVMHHPDRVALIVIAVWWIASIITAWYTRRRAPRATPWLFALDFIVIAILLMTTGGVSSVYFPMIVMSPFAANLLYGRRTILIVAACGVLVYFGALAVTPPGSIDPRVVIIRFGIVVLLGTAVVLRAKYEERVHRDMEQLATWPHAVAADRDTAVRELLARAATALRTSRAAAAWREEDGSSSFGQWFAQIDGQTFELEEESFEHIVVPEPDRPAAFLASSDVLGGRLSASSIIGAKFTAQTVEGWLFIIDLRAATADDLMLTEIVARLVSAGLDQINLVVMMREGAAAAERIRLSRDLHDGLLQSLSGLALHVQSARRTIATDPRSAEQRLQVVVEQLAVGQRTLRDFVDELRPELVVRRQPLRMQLERMTNDIAAQWNVKIDLDATREIDALDAALARHLMSLVAEALTNAAKHAGATRIGCVVAVDDQSIRIDIEDDGHGFPFRGRYGLRQLVAEQRGPWSLKERVVALGGDMAIDSTTSGSRVEVRLPRAS